MYKVIIVTEAIVYRLNVFSVESDVSVICVASTFSNISNGMCKDALVTKEDQESSQARWEFDI